MCTPQSHRILLKISSEIIYSPVTLVAGNFNPSQLMKLKLIIPILYICFKVTLFLAISNKKT